MSSALNNPSQEVQVNDQYSVTKVFISHISEEGDVARKLGSALEEDFHGVLEVYVSSEPEHAEVGGVWLSRIERELKEASILLILCSDVSIKRPWINFESGAAWLAGKTLIPVCHLKLTPDRLPLPFRTLQGVTLSEREGMRGLYAAVARMLKWRQSPKLGERALEIIGVRPNFRRKWQHTILTKDRNSTLAESDPWAIAINEKQHVVYLGEDNHIHEIASLGNWIPNDLTVESGALDSDINPVGRPFCYNDYDILHITYRASNDNIYEFWWDKKWKYANLTEASSKADHPRTPLAADNPTGYAYFYSQHIIYRGVDNHIHELWWNDTPTERIWNHTDINATAVTGDNEIPEAAGSPIGYALNRKQHVIYRGLDGHIHELWWNGAKDRQWHYTNLSIEAGKSTPLSKGDPSVYEHEGTLHVVYRDVNDDIQELWWNDGWHRTNLIETIHKSGEDISKANGNPYGYVRGHNQHVIYRGMDGHIHELIWDYGWSHNDLTVASSESTNTSTPRAAGDPVGYVLSGNQNVIYRGNDNNIHQLLRT